MPGKHGFPAYCAALAALPATARQIGAQNKMLPKSAGGLMRGFWALGLVHPGGVIGRVDLVAGGQAETVWHLGEGPAVSRRVSKMQPYATHIALAYIVRALRDGATTKEVADAAGISLSLAQQRVKEIRKVGLCFVAEWAKDASGRAVARYEWGRGKDVPKPPPLSHVERWRRGLARKRTTLLQRTWAQAANEEKRAA